MGVIQRFLIGVVNVGLYGFWVVRYWLTGKRP